jgi:hypothetical protein
MTNTTNAQLSAVLQSASNAARSAGVDPTGWTLYGGSKSNGVSYRLATGGTLIHLGMTKNEAWHSLSMMAEAFRMVAQANAEAGS